MIVDINERADLLERIHKGILHNLTCPNCNQAVGQANAPLLVYRPKERFPLLYSPASQITPEQERKQTAGLVDMLRTRVGNSWKDLWLEQGLAIVPRSLLAAALDDEPEAAMQRITEQAVLKLGELRQSDPAIYQEIVEQLREQKRKLQSFEAIEDFIQISTWIAAYKYAKTHSELLSDDVDELLRKVITAAQSRDHSDAEEAFEDMEVLQELPALLIRCREIGIEHAFAEKMGITPEDLEEISVADAASDVIPELEEALRLMYEALDRYQSTGDQVTLSVISTAWEHINKHLAFKQTQESFQLAAKHVAAIGFVLQYEASDNLNDLDEAIDLYRELVNRTLSDSSELRDTSFVELGLLLDIRFEYTKTLEDLDKALTAWQKALTHLPIDLPELPLCLNHLGVKLYVRYQQIGLMEALEQAMEALQKAVDLAPAASPELPPFLNDLGVSQRAYYNHTGDLHDLEQAITSFQRAIEYAPSNSPSQSHFLDNLGEGFHVRHRRTERSEDLEQAISSWQRALEYISADLPAPPRLLNNLGGGVLTRYTLTGQLEDLEQAITLFERAVNLTLPDSPDLPRYLSNLGSSIQDRYKQTGQLQDLEQAISLMQRAIQLAPADFSDFSSLQ